MADYTRRTMKQYKWQWEFTNIFDKPQKISMRRLRWAVNKACALYQVKPPTVNKRMTKHGATSHYIYDTSKLHKPGRIELLSIHMNLPCVLHEVAHAIRFQRYPKLKEDDHGPTWLGIYIDLLDRFYVLPKHASKPSLAKWGLSFKRITPPGIKKARRR